MISDKFYFYLLPSFSSDKPHYPYKLPKGWEWTTLGDCIYVKSGTSINVRNNQTGCVPIYGGNGINGYCSTPNVEKTTIVIGRVGFNCGSVHFVKEKAWVTDNAFITTIIGKGYTEEFLLYLLEQLNLKKYANSTAQPVISGAKIYPITVPLPPYAEQQRIVNAIKISLSLINIVENGKEELQTSIKRAKSKVLDLAIHGKLVPQDPNDESASELLKRINPKAEIISDNGHYQNLPKGWCLTTLESITNYGSCVNVSVQEIPKDAWVLELEDIEKDSAKILCARHKKDREIKGVRHRFKAGDILYSKLRTYLNKVLIAPNEGFCTTEIIPISVKLGIHNKYICHVLRSQAFLDYTAQCGYGVKMPRLSTKDAQNGIIPLPPYNEQLRIVSMVEKLLADLGTIEESLAR